MLRLQQYERLLKAIAAHQDIEGPADCLQSIRDSKVEELSNKTLGHLVGVLTGSYLTVESGGIADETSNQPRLANPSKVWFRMRSSITMSPEGYAETVQQLRELVTLGTTWSITSSRRLMCGLSKAVGMPSPTLMQPT